MNPPRRRDENVTGASRLPAKPLQTASTPIPAAEVAEEFSHHHPSVARLNNGSFGSCPASVSAAQLRWQQLFLRQPDEFYFHHLKPGILRSRALLRDLVNAVDIEEISLVDNATTAVAIVLQHASWAFAEGAFRKGDAVVILHYAYPAVKKSIHAYIARSGGHVIEVPLAFPISSDEEIIREFCNALERAEAEGRRVRLAVICHVTSMPSVVIPVKQLTRICREAGVDQVFVDGAHSIGNVEVDVQDIGADFYTSNLHKWFFCPPSAAFLYTKKASTSPPPPPLHHPVVSHEYGNGLPTESSWIGTRDYSPQLVVPSAMEFINRFEGGIRGIQKRNHESVVKMGEMLAAAWETLLGSPPAMCSSMIMVGLPGRLGVSSAADALNLRSLLREEFEVEVPVHFHPLAGGGSHGVTGYVRISHQVYNVEDDYYRLRDAVLKLVHDGITCSMIPTAQSLY